ncbi:hypothetical protein B6D29_02140 [Microgenomates bacterium UTCPR1]|nr:MAG: hypothetical protein B6D29_02140 [Microgenomates bacterium UTCPR1]
MVSEWLIRRRFLRINPFEYAGIIAQSNVGDKSFDRLPRYLGRSLNYVFNEWQKDGMPNKGKFISIMGLDTV